DQIKEKARIATAGKSTDYGKALAIEAWLRRNCQYSLNGEVGGPNVVDDFLVAKRRGHCALFASAMVVMARCQGIPARYVTGFLADDQQQDGSFRVTGRDGHAWVEVYIDRAGWVAFDPTAGSIPVPGSKEQV